MDTDVYYTSLNIQVITHYVRPKHTSAEVVNVLWSYIYLKRVNFENSRTLRGDAMYSGRIFLMLLRNPLTYLLTPWSSVLLEKLTSSAASQEIPRIFGTRRLLIVLTSARHLSLS